MLLGSFARNQIEMGHYDRAEQLAERAVSVNEKALSPDHPSVAESLLGLGSVFVKEKKYSDADAAFQKALGIYDKSQGPGSMNAMRTVFALLGVYSLEGKEAETEPLVKRVQTMVSKTPDTLKPLRTSSAQKEAWGVQFALGAMYEKGLGVKQDYTEALKWYGTAAENGDALACIRIARAHEEGLGVPKDGVEAYKWYALAGAGHPDWDEHKRQLVAQLSTEQLSDAEKRIAAWQAQHANKP